MIPKVIKEYKMRNANMVQKYMRGYIDWTKVNKVLIDYKLNKHNKFFAKMKLELEKESVDHISRYYLRYKIKKLAIQEAELAKINHEKLEAKRLLESVRRKKRSSKYVKQSIGFDHHKRHDLKNSIKETKARLTI